MSIVDAIVIFLGMITLSSLIVACIGVGANLLFKKHPRVASVLLCVVLGYSVVMFLKYAVGS